MMTFIHSSPLGPDIASSYVWGSQPVTLVTQAFNLATSAEMTFLSIFVIVAEGLFDSPSELASEFVESSFADDSSSDADGLAAESESESEDDGEGDGGSPLPRWCICAFLLLLIGGGEAEAS